jgi:hypothetical protein
MNTSEHTRNIPVKLILSLLVLLVIGAFYTLTSNSINMYEHDSSCYMGVARSLTTGQGYWFNNRPHTLYPPGFPLILAGLIRLFGENITIFFRFLSFCAGALLFLIFFYYQKRKEPWGLLFCLILAFSPVYYIYSTRIVFSDIPYMIATIGFIFTYEWLYRKKERKFLIIWIFLGLFLFLLTMMIRSLGLSMAAALGFTLLIAFINRKKTGISLPFIFITGFFILGGLIYFLAWSKWTANNTVFLYPGEYLQSYFEIVKMVNPNYPDLGQTTAAGFFLRIIRNFFTFGSRMAEGFTNLYWIKSHIFSPPFLVIFLFAFIGWIKEIRRDNPLAGLYVLFYLGLILIWPSDKEGKRLFLSVAPFIFLFFAIGARTVINSILESSPKRIGGFGLAISALAIIVTLIQAFFFTGTTKQDYAVILFWAVLMAGSVTILIKGADLSGLKKYGYIVPIIGIIYLTAYISLGAPKIKTLASLNVRPDFDKINNTTDYRASNWLQENSGTADVFMANNFAGIHFATGHPVIPLPVTADKNILKEALEAANPQFIVINDARKFNYFNPIEPERLTVMREAFPDGFTLVHEYEGGKIYSFKH